MKSNLFRFISMRGINETINYTTAVHFIRTNINRDRGVLESVMHNPDTSNSLIIEAY